MIDFRTLRLTIEPLDPMHAEALFAALDDPRVTAHIAGPGVPTLDDLRRRIVRVLTGPPPGSAETWCNWVVLLNGTVIGRLEATLHHEIAEIAYLFGPRWWGHGYATEATAWMLDEVRRMGATACWATVEPANDASIRLLARLGFTRVDPPYGALVSYDPGDLVFRL
jgi:RimJ/RimL family protein N-acetyltransferase